jgi:hypothetical protein
MQGWRVNILDLSFHCAKFGLSRHLHCLSGVGSSRVSDRMPETLPAGRAFFAIKPRRSRRSRNEDFRRTAGWSAPFNATDEGRCLALQASEQKARNHSST